MYTKTFKLNNKPAYKRVHKLLEMEMIDNGNISVSTCKKANRITVTGDDMYSMFKAWRNIGMTPKEYYELAVR